MVEEPHELLGNHWSPSDLLGSMFSGASAYDLQNYTLLQALNFPIHGDHEMKQHAENLLRAAVAAELNATSLYVITYYKSATWIRKNVNDALLYGNKGTVNNLAAILDAWNNLGVPEHLLETRLAALYP